MKVNCRCANALEASMLLVFYYFETHLIVKKNPFVPLVKKRLNTATFFLTTTINGCHLRFKYKCYAEFFWLAFLRRLFNAWRDIPKLSAAMD